MCAGAVFFLLIVAFGPLLAPVSGHATACNQDNDVLCLEGDETYVGVRGYLKDGQRFWFGENYNTRCPASQGRYSVDCYNPAPEYHSIITRMRMSQDNETESVTQVLQVEYAAKGPGYFYKGCGMMLEVEAVGYGVDATHSVRRSVPSLKQRPSIMWTAETNALYTLVFWDPSHFRLHGCWVNLEDSVDGGDEVMPYIEAVNFQYERNPFVFALYKQSEQLNVTAVDQYIKKLMAMYGIIKLNMFADEFSLSGPEGISFLQMKKDAYSADRGRMMNKLNNCPYIATSGLEDMDTGRFNKTGVELSVSVDVHFQGAAQEVNYCCHKRSVPERPRDMYSMYMQQIEPVHTQMEPKVRLVHTQLHDDPTFFTHRWFTLLLLDVTARNVTLNSGPYVHWMVINIRDSELQTGSVEWQYQGAVVPHPSPQRLYLFLLLEQVNGQLMSSSVHSYVGHSCAPTPLDHRCEFDLPRFQDELDLRVVGLNGFYALPDAWSRKQGYTTYGMTQSVTCQGMSGWANPCPPTSPPSTCSGVDSLPSLAALALVVSFLVSVLCSRV